MRSCRSRITYMVTACAPPAKTGARPLHTESASFAERKRFSKFSPTTELVIGVHFLDFFSQLGYDFEAVTNDAISSMLEDFCFRIVVDGNNYLRRIHAGQVLNGAGDSASDVELRADCFTGLTDLVLVIDPAGVDNCS